MRHKKLELDKGLENHVLTSETDDEFLGLLEKGVLLALGEQNYLTVGQLTRLEERKTL